MSHDASDYLPASLPGKVVAPGDFVFGASHFDHGHIYDQVRGLIAAGGTCKYLYDPNAERFEPLRELIDAHGIQIADRFEQLLEDPELHLVTSAAIPNLRCEIGLRVLEAGKDYFTDKAPFTTLEQLAEARRAVTQTGRKYMVCYSERLVNESAWQAGELIRQGVIGRVLQVLNLAPHNLGAAGRPEWFFQKERFGGILTDIGSHQFEQFLAYAGATGGAVEFARVENFGNPDHPEFEDYGEASVTLDTGASGYCRLDWFNPKGSRIWGDGRTFILGDQGYMELRKYINVGREDGGDRIYLADQKDTYEIDCRGKVGFPFFGQLILDVLNRTEAAMTQAHAFKAAELSLEAQALADARRDQR
ncbi:MAG: oxidoreductase domain-containing protein [Puniceicoccaceae bacterium 5H]|nr:MAG: oxidoreductase domain-containing protein [Puniceicoccaceae bacterium 5H]